ncbi:MAG: ATP-binding cassette domain-containing protein [Kiritimatiellae bacterium]|nr:ATP-binding cassette domain-containing protein [Kiritimatiellia bacterium]
MIVLDHIDINQGAFSVRNVCMNIPQNAYAVLMGSTGSGKTTLLEIICGLRQPDCGRVLLNECDVTHATPAARDVGYVPQDGALFKTMTVFEQLAFSLVVRREHHSAIETRVSELAGLLDIEHILDRTPAGLSGGERQRVALGRALSFRPGILLLDEPLTALDDETRSQIMHLLKQVQQHTGVTVLHVTHNRSEAEQLGTMMLCISNGCVQALTQDKKEESYV